LFVPPSVAPEPDATTPTPTTATGPASPSASPSPSAAPAWVDEVIASELFAVQLGALGRSKPPPDRVRSAMAALAQRGGVASFATIAASTGMPLTRVAPFLAVLTRLLNADGYAVLTVDQSGEAARLDEALARSQYLSGV